MKTLKLLVVIGIVFLQSCAITRVSSSRYGDKAKIVVSPNYQYSRTQKIVVMPFQAIGKDRPESEFGTTDKFVLKIMELGLYTIIDRGMIESFYYEYDIAEDATLNRKQLELIKEELGVDLIFYGAIDYSYKPSVSSGETDKSGNYSESSRGGYYALQSESLRVVSTTTGEVVMTAYASDSYCGSMSQEMAYAINKKVSMVD